MSVAATGRGLTPDSPPLMQLMELVTVALEQSCAGAPATAKRHGTVEQLPLAGIRSVQLPSG